MSASFLTSVGAGAVFFLLLHVGIWRAVPDNSPRMTLLGVLMLVGIGASLAVDAALGIRDGLELWAVAWTGASLGVIYIIFYSGVARSVSLTLLARVLRDGTRPVRLSDLVQEYEASARFEDRIRLMHESDLIRLSGDMAALTDRGVRLARWSRGLSRIIGNGLEG